jgi:hypothetical protein
VKKMDRPVTVSHIRIIAPKTDASTPDGLAAAFRHGATECLMNAEDLACGKTANLTGHYIVTLHALELALKAFLARKGLTETALSKKPYGHNLVALYSEAVKWGFSLPFPRVEHLNKYHRSGASLRYNFSEMRDLPLCSDLFPMISELLNASK